VRDAFSTDWATVEDSLSCFFVAHFFEKEVNFVASDRKDYSDLLEPSFESQLVFMQSCQRAYQQS